MLVNGSSSFACVWEKCRREAVVSARLLSSDAESLSRVLKIRCFKEATKAELGVESLIIVLMPFSEKSKCHHYKKLAVLK